MLEWSGHDEGCPRSAGCPDGSCICGGREPELKTCQDCWQKPCTCVHLPPGETIRRRQREPKLPPCTIDAPCNTEGCIGCAPAMEVVNIARCPDHGLHGERDTCFICDGPVEQVPMVEVSAPTMDEGMCLTCGKMCPYPGYRYCRRECIPDDRNVFGQERWQSQLPEPRDRAADDCEIPEIVNDDCPLPPEVICETHGTYHPGRKSPLQARELLDVKAWRESDHRLRAELNALRGERDTYADTARRYLIERDALRPIVEAAQRFRHDTLAYDRIPRADELLDAVAAYERTLGD